MRLLKLVTSRGWLPGTWLAKGSAAPGGSADRPVRVISLGPLPPPIHGMAVTNEAVTRSLEPHADLVVVNTAVPNRVGIPHHLRRIARHIGGLRTVIARRGHRGYRTLYLTCPGGLSLWYLLPIAGAARLLAYRIVVHHNTYRYLNEPTVVMRLFVRALGSRGRHVLLSPRMTEQFEAIYKPCQPSLICSNVAFIEDLPVDAMRQTHPQERFRFGYLGSISEEKGLLILRDVLVRARSAGIDAELWLAGKPMTERDRSLLEEIVSGCAPDVRHFGELAGQEKASFLAALNAFIFPTRYRLEAEPLVIYEAMRAGLPVAVFDRGCIRDQVKSAGLVVAPETDFPAAAIPFLLDLAADEYVARRARAASRARFDAARAIGQEQSRTLLRALLSAGSCSTAQAVSNGA